MRPRAAWATLGIAATTEVAAIRRAYADRLRAMDPDADPAAFDRLREARAVALAAAQRGTPPPAAEPAAAAAEDRADAGGDRHVPLPAATIAAPVLDASGRGTVAIPEPAWAPPSGLAPGKAPDAAPALEAGLPRASLALPEIEVDAPAGGLAIPAPDAAQRVDAAYERIVALLLPDGEWSADPLDADAQAALDAALATATADPRLEELAFRARAEQWFAAVLADAMPRSDPVVPRIVGLFGWRERAGTIGEEPAIEQVTDRARALRFADAVQDPRHRFHKAWAELTDALPERRFAPWRAGRRAQRELLDEIRRRLPALEGWLDPARVEKLENRVSGPGIPSWAFGLIAVALLRLCAQALPDTPADGPLDGNASAPIMAAGESQPLAVRDTDLNVALLDVANGFTADVVRRDNPALFLALDRMWQDAHRRGERVEPFRRRVSVYLDGQLRRAILQARYDDIAAYRRLERATFRKLADLAPGQCATARGTDPALTLTDVERQERRALRARMLLAVAPGMPPAREGTFRVPDEAMAIIGEATSLSRAGVSQALGNRGDPAAICRVRAALIDAALALPRKEGLPLLRAM